MYKGFNVSKSTDKLEIIKDIIKSFDPDMVYDIKITWVSLDCGIETIVVPNLEVHLIGK